MFVGFLIFRNKFHLAAANCSIIHITHVRRLSDVLMMLLAYSNRQKHLHELLLIYSHLSESRDSMMNVVSSSNVNGL